MIKKIEILFLSSFLRCNVNYYFCFLQNRSTSVRVHRAGGSLSLSEQEFDSDEMEIPLNLSAARPRPINLSQDQSSTTASSSNTSVATTITKPNIAYDKESPSNDYY